MSTTEMDSCTFYFEEQRLWCEKVDLKILMGVLHLKNHCSGPVFVYSKQKLINNINAYKCALAERNFQYFLGYALKANSNFHLLKIVQQLGCFAITVSGNEIKLALLAGFLPDHIIFNGNGKQFWEIQLAIKRGCILNIDSIFDAENIISVANNLEKKCSVLLRLNPILDAKVHPHNCTALATSKFGIELKQLDNIVHLITNNRYLTLLGLHCHIGSTISDVSIYEDVLRILLQTAHKLRERGFADLNIINIGGGLGIDYSKLDAKFPTPKELVHSLYQQVPDMSHFTLLLEPGRSLIGNTGVLLADITGVKSNGGKKFIVTNAAMTEVIRPSLYAAYHHISLLDFSNCQNNEKECFDIVGPVCESGDFLGKERLLPYPDKDAGLVIWDVGAYCFAMSSNYNLRGKVPEVLIEGASWKLIRKAETFEDLLKSFVDVPMGDN